MNGSHVLHLTKNYRVAEETLGIKGAEISLGRVATWTTIFTNTFFIAYFFMKLFQWV